jgi:hypothetical protein
VPVRRPKGRPDEPLEAPLLSTSWAIRPCSRR